MSICADDFGMSEAIDEGILQLGAAGVLTATSCLVQGPTFEKNAARLNFCHLQAGLHLNFTEALDPAALCLPLSVLIRRTWLRQLKPQIVRQTIVRQLDRFEQVLGRQPHHIDGHQHVHQFPQIRDALLAEMLRRYPRAAMPRLRCTVPPLLRGLPAATRFKAAVIAMLGARRLRHVALSHGIPMNHGFLGVYDFHGGDSAYAGLLQTWRAAAGPNDLLMCHPAAFTDPDDPLGAQRHAEFRVLAAQLAG